MDLFNLFLYELSFILSELVLLLGMLKIFVYWMISFLEEMGFFNWDLFGVYLLGLVFLEFG